MYNAGHKMGHVMFEFFDHTADLGVRIEAHTLAELFSDAGRAFTAMVVDNVQTVQPFLRERIAIAGAEIDYLMLDWLRELLASFETNRMLYCHFAVKVDESGLTADVAGEPFDPSRHQLGHEVKAITYHGLSVVKHADRWTAEVIVDI